MRVFLFIIFITYQLLAKYDATLTISKEVEKKGEISLIDCSPSNKKSKKIYQLFLDDLKISGNFLVKGDYKKGDFQKGIDPLKEKVPYILKYRYSEALDGAKLDIRLFSSSSSTELLNKSYSVTTSEKYPFLIHKAVSDINNFLKFPKIDWINRYVIFSYYTGAKKSKIAIADYTFSYVKTIIYGALDLFPHWADKKQHMIYYSNYSGDLITLYRLNIYTGEKKKILTSQGMLICSDVSDNNFNKLLLTMAPSSQPDIYLYNNGNLKKITTFKGIDVGGKFANNEKEVVFVSNRLGKANIFKKVIGQKGVIQIVFNGTNNDSCDVANKKVVYSSKEGRGKYNLYLTTINGGTPRPLTSGGVNQFPRFSIDGDVIMYIKRSYKGNSIGYINLRANISKLFDLKFGKIQSIDW